MLHILVGIAHCIIKRAPKKNRSNRQTVLCGCRGQVRRLITRLHNSCLFSGGSQSVNRYCWVCEVNFRTTYAALHIDTLFLSLIPITPQLGGWGRVSSLIVPICEYRNCFSIKSLSFTFLYMTISGLIKSKCVVRSYTYNCDACNLYFVKT